MKYTVNLNFEDSDLRYFWKILRQSRANTINFSQSAILSKTKKLSEKMAGNITPFIDKNLDMIKVFVAMLEDPNWHMPDQESEDILAALTYFNDNEDLIPDNYPGLGFLDDAIMLEIVAESLTYGIKDFGEYCNYRDSEHLRSANKTVTSKQWLADKRHEKHYRLKQRNARDHGSTATFHSIF